MGKEGRRDKWGQAGWGGGGGVVRMGRRAWNKVFMERGEHPRDRRGSIGLHDITEMESLVRHTSKDFWTGDCGT
jgi:hypothetical protein